MPILNRIQRRSVPGRTLLGIFYVLLVFGSIWMVYPFLLMIGGSMKTEIDSRQMDIIPKFLRDEEMLYKKFSEQRYGRVDIAVMNARVTDKNGKRLYTFESLSLPVAPPAKEYENWKNFVKSTRGGWPYFYRGLGHGYGVRAISEVGYTYSKSIRKAYPETPLIMTPLAIVPEEWYSRNYLPPQGKNGKVYWNMRKGLDDRFFYPISIEGVYALYSVAIHYGSGADALTHLNQEWGTHYAAIGDVELKPSLPANPNEQKIWTDFVQHYLSTRYVQFGPELLPSYEAFLKGKYGEISALNEVYKTEYKNWSEIPFPGPDAADLNQQDTSIYLKSLKDLSKVRIRSLDFDWRNFLASKYGPDIHALNAAWGTNYGSYGEIKMPVAWEDLDIVRQNKTAILWELVSRNYRYTWDLIASSGNGLRNTVIFCLLNILTALLVNPLAAYALSRFQPRWGQTALFLLMATMAFPGEVTQIPSFLLLRNLGWLNTFAALVIPAAANGYSIFLLKGFFDSLPHDLYEAASLDGCGELRAFFTITVPLSGPILAVIALGAFTSAYGAFMFALLVCQKESMWTLMVYIYQLQQSYNSPVIFAALIIAAIPTLLVFIFCQNIIMKGIVVPVEK